VTNVFLNYTFLILYTNKTHQVIKYPERIKNFEIFLDDEKGDAAFACNVFEVRNFVSTEKPNLKRYVNLHVIDSTPPLIKLRSSDCNPVYISEISHNASFIG
jgi:hypothetical protein